MGKQPLTGLKNTSNDPETLSTEGPSIALKGSIPLSLAFHPSKDLLAISTITGDIRCYEYNSTTTRRQFSSKHHKDSVRCVRFNPDGSHLYSCSVDKSIQVLDMHTKQVIQKKSKAHDRAINTLLPLNQMLVASGDDSGQVRVWDLRSKSVVQQWQEHNDDTVTDLHWVPHKKSLMSTGADGYLSVYDIRKPNVIARSDNMETELQCIVSINGGSRLAVGQGDGAVSIWKWGWFGDMVDRFPGHPGSIDAMVALADDLVVTGSSDGIVRALSVFPNKFLGIIGTHDEFPIENLSTSHDRKWLASSSHDMTVRMWNLSFLDNENSNVDQISDNEGEKVLSSVDKGEVEDNDNSPIDIIGEDNHVSKMMASNAPLDVNKESHKHVIPSDESSASVGPATHAGSSDEEPDAILQINSDSNKEVSETAKTHKRRRKRQKQSHVFQASASKLGSNSQSFFSGL